MKKVWAFIARQGFFIMLALCVLMIAGSGYWALNVKKTEQSLEADGSPEFVYTLEQAEKLRVYRPVHGEALMGYASVSYQPTLDCWAAHEAVDFGAESGSAVCSAQAGSVTEAFRDAQWGGVIVIGHDNGMITKYCGLAWPVAKAAGDPVEAGEYIGNVGALPIESAEMSHLHFEMEIDGNPVDPLLYM